MTYELLPFVHTPERAEIISHMLRKIATHETLFSNFQEICPKACVKTLTLPEMCPACQHRMQTVASALAAPNSVTWEVWSPEADLVGIIYFTDIIPGQDAKGHYVFFDGRLNSKTDVILQAMGAMWTLVPRLTVEIPAPFAALARHASRRLGFGGGFRYKGGLSVEGVKKRAVRWRGGSHDLLILGRFAPQDKTPLQVVDPSNQSSRAGSSPSAFINR